MLPQPGTSANPAQIGAERYRDIQKAFDDALVPNQKAWAELHSPVPDLLYHYTDLDGLKGIATKSTIWASDVRFMNDASELSYASGLIAEEASKVFESVSDPRAKSILPNTPAALNAFDFGLRPFSACFCEYPDLLSQWRGYGRNSEIGYSLGLDLRSPHMMLPGLPPGTFFRKVIYEPAEQRSWARRIVESWVQTGLSLLDSMHDLSPENVFTGLSISWLRLALAEQHCCFKHYGFKEESEWRFIVLVDVEGISEYIEMSSSPPGAGTGQAPKVLFRPTPLGFVPYVELPIWHKAGPFMGKLPLRRVKQGPAPNRELSLESLRLYLKHQGFMAAATDISASEIPLR